MRHKKQALIKSFLALLLCFSMLVGSTFAWFTDGVASGINMIAAGTLDVELYHSNAVASGEPVDANTSLFLDLQGRPILWEPGAVSYENLRVTNAGDLALAYQLAIATDNENFVVETSGAQYGLSQILKVGVVRGGITAADRQGVVDSVADADWTTLENFVHNGSLLPEGAGTSEELWGVVIYWEPGEFDNYWNLNNGKTLSSGDVLSIDLGISLIATQEVHEVDAFGADYDSTAAVDVFPVFVPAGSATTTVVPDADNKVASDMVMTAGQISAAIPAGVKLAEGTTALTMSITEMDATNGNITVNAYTEASRSLDVHIEGIGSDNTVPMEISIPQTAPKGLNLGNLTLYHVENDVPVEMTLVAQDAAFTAHNQFKYDPATGDIVLYMATFSEIAVVADKEAAWEGEVDHSWYVGKSSPYTIANADQLWSFSQIVGGMAEGIEQDSFSGKTVNLIVDIDLADGEGENVAGKIFYPIGYNSSDGKYEKTGVAVTTGFYTFAGIFDGQGHSISNFYHNTWEMKGDNSYYDATLQYYRDGMGLFGKVYGGTVKNLTVENFTSDGEYTTTGVIAAYADGATFENISIFNCNPRVYNTGNGGIVGCVGWYAKEANLKTTFKNITVDNSNKISALWSSYDVACGGIVGQYYPTSGQSSAGTPANGGISFENCHVAAQMDVYNDVCGNYQYYAYRYAGMMIGSIRENETIDGHVYPKMDGITATGCTVHYDTWNDYFYCELVANSKASYTHDHQFSRLTEVKKVDGTQITYLNDTTGTVPSSGSYNYVVVNGDCATENATCYHFVDGKEHSHKDYNGDSVEDYETVNGEKVLVEDKQHIYLPFTQLFTGYGWGVTSKGLTDYEGVQKMDITYRENATLSKKFEKNDALDGSFLYRVGNKNAFPIGKLFQETSENIAVDSGVYVSVESLIEGVTLNGTFTKNETDWTQSTLHITGGTGPAKLTIQDYNNCEAFEFVIEVVDAVNATAATNATSSNVVLLNDCGFSSLEVSGGYTLYGNGFTMTCSSDSAALNTGYEFVAVNNGTLDNVQIVCPNFDYAVLYSSNMTESGNRSETTDRTRYFNVKSAVEVNGNSQILNSRISGGRAALNVVGGNVVVDNSRIELGAVASVLVGSANSLTLRDVTLVQKPTASTHDSSKTLMGFSVLFVCDANGDTAPVTLEGTLVQNAWVKEDYKQFVPGAGQSIISTVLGKTEYLHDIDGDGTKESLNLGFAYMPESLTSKVNTTTITDNRTNKNTVPYDYAEVSILSGKTYVYSYKNTNGTEDDFKTEGEYKPNDYGDIIDVSYADPSEGLNIGKSFGTDGWVYELNVDLDKLPGYALDFSKLSMSVNGVAVTDFKVNGNTKPTSPVAVTAGGTNYTLTATVNGKDYTATFKVIGTETSKESPSLVGTPSYSAGFGVANSYNGDWSAAAPVLDGITIKYWSVAENAYKEFALSSITFANQGKQNGSNSYWEYTHTNNDFTLKLTNTVAMHDKSQTFGIPVVGQDNKLYFTIASTGGFVGNGTSSRSITMKYEFTDNNGGTTLTFSHTWKIDQDEANQYNYNSFVKDGTLTKLESSGSGGGGGCVTGDTLVTLADGSKKMVKNISVNDMLLVWDFFKGEYAAVPAALIIDHGTGNYNLITLTFEDGTVVNAVGAHAFFDADANAFVMITPENVQTYIGHSFVKAADNGYETVKLVDAEVSEQNTDSYSIVSSYHYNFIVEDMFSLTNLVPSLLAGLEVGENMRYDEATLQADIAKYGLYTYADFADYVEEDTFNALSGPYLKISAGKGYTSYEEIVDLIIRFVNH